MSTQEDDDEFIVLDRDWVEKVGPEEIVGRASV